MVELDEVFTRGSELDTQLLAGLIQPYLVIDLDDDNRVVFNEAGHEETIENRILLFLLARKALLKKGLIEEEGISPSLIISGTGLKPGTVHPTLKSLKAKGLLVATNGLYLVPNYQMYKLKKRLLKGDLSDGG